MHRSTGLLAAQSPGFAQWKARRCVAPMRDYIEGGIRMDDQEISELDYFEVQVQLQILEHVADKGPLSEGNVALQRELEEREKVLIREKLAQPFAKYDVPTPPITKHLDQDFPDPTTENEHAWREAREHSAFTDTANALAERHLRDDANLIRKQQEEESKLGQSSELNEMQTQEKLVHLRHFDEERGRYAREFLERRKLLEELERNETGLEKDKGHEFSH